MPKSTHAKHGPPSALIVVSLIVVLATTLWLVFSQTHDGTRQTSHTTKGSTSKAGTSTTASSPSSTAAPVPTTDASTSSTAPTLPVSPFNAAITDYLSGRTGTLTAALYDVQTGQTYGLSPGSTQDEASVVKVDILATLLSQQSDGSVPSSASEQDLLTSMIEDSDNDSATTLWNQVGGPGAINSFNQQIGMTDTVPSSCVTCPNFPWPGWGLTTTTADDQIKLLRQFVFPSSLLTSAQRTYGLQLMENITSSESWGVNGGVPSGVTVALKNGWLPLSGETNWQVNSVGWIDGDGRNYIVAVLTTGNPTEQYGIDTINNVSTLLWSQLG